MTTQFDAFSAILDTAPNKPQSGPVIPEPTETDRQFAEYVIQNRIKFSAKRVPASAFDNVGVNVAAVNVVLKEEHNLFLRAVRNEKKEPESYTLRPAVRRNA